MAPSRVSPKTDSDRSPERLSSFLKRINFDVDLSPSAKQNASPKPKQVAPFAPPRVSSANASAPVKAAKPKPSAPVEANLSAAPEHLKAKKLKPSASPPPQPRPARFLSSPNKKLSSPPSIETYAKDFFSGPTLEDYAKHFFSAPHLTDSQRGKQILTTTPRTYPRNIQRVNWEHCHHPIACPKPRRILTIPPWLAEQTGRALLDKNYKNSPEHKERLLAILKSEFSSQSTSPATTPSRADTPRPQSKSPSHNLPVDYIQHTLRSSSIGATMSPVADNFGLNASKYAPATASPRLGQQLSNSSLSTHSKGPRPAYDPLSQPRSNSSLSTHSKGPRPAYNPLEPLARSGTLRPVVPQQSDFQQPHAVRTPLVKSEDEDIDYFGTQAPQQPIFQSSEAVRSPDVKDEHTRHYFHSEVHRRAPECQALKEKEEELERRGEHERRIFKERELRNQAQDQRNDRERRIARQPLSQVDVQRRDTLARQTEIQGEENQRRLALQAKALCEVNDRLLKEEAERHRLALIAKQKAAEKAEAERVAELKRRHDELQRQKAELRAQEEERQRAAKFKAEGEERERIAKLKAEEERQRVAKLKAEEEERQRLAKLKAEEERQRIAEEEERQRLAKLKAEAERKARELELLMQGLRQDATDKIHAHLIERLEAFENFMAQLDEKMSRKAAGINSFENNIAAKETEIAELEKQLDNLKSELSSMADTKMEMEKDFREIQLQKSEYQGRAEVLKQDAATQLEKLQDTSLSSEDVENILASFIPTDNQIEVPELELSQLSLRDRSECGEAVAGESSDDEEGEVNGSAPVEHPVFWAWMETGIEADRVVKLINLPTNATVVDIQALIWGGPLAQIEYTPGSTEAKVYFLDGKHANRYYDATANHIPYPGDEDRLIEVHKCDPSPRHPFLRWALETGVTRNILCTGMPEWTKADCKSFASKHGREVEQVLYGKTKSGLRIVEFRFLNIHHANAFKHLLKTDIELYTVKTEYAKDQCAVHRNVHLGAR
ncbi:hypothetical protein IWZ01DRAFT_481447 [Phyllosticta capitalensis]